MLDHPPSKQRSVKAGQDIDILCFECVAIDYGSDGEILVIDIDFSLVDGHLLSLPAVGLEWVSETVELLTDCSVLPLNGWFDPSIRQTT